MPQSESQAEKIPLSPYKKLPLLAGEGYPLTDYRNPDQLVEILHQQGYLKPPADFGDSERRFFSGRSVLLHNMHSGAWADSAIYFFTDLNSNETGLVKIFRQSQENWPKIIQKYRESTQKVIDNIEDINRNLGVYTKYNAEIYSLQLEVVPVGETEENEGMTGLFITGDRWIRGNNLASNHAFEWLDKLRSCQNNKVEIGIEPDLGDLIAVQNITQGVSQNMVAFPRFKYTALRTFLEEQLDPKLALIGQIPNGRNLVLPLNIKVRVDFQRKRIFLVITDIASVIHSAYRE